MKSIKLSEKLEKKMLLFGVSVSFLCSFAAVLINRVEFLDGSAWIFNIISEESFYWDPRLSRYTDILLQIPSVLVVKYMDGAFSLYLSKLLLGISYYLHPYLSLYISWKIIKHHDQWRVFYFPLLSFAICTQPVLGYAISVVSTALSIFWPLFLLNLYSPKPSTSRVAVLVLLSTLLLFSYETVMIVLIPLAFLNLLRGRIEEDGQIAFRLNLLFILQFLIAIYLFWSSFFNTSKSVLLYFWHSKNLAVNSLYLYFTLGCLLFIPLAYDYFKFPWLTFRRYCICLLLFITCFIFICFNEDQWMLLYERYASRIYTMPAVFFIVLCTLFPYITNKRYLIFQKNSKILTLTLMIFLFSTCYEYLSSAEWVRSRNHLKKLISNSKPCQYMDSARFYWPINYTAVYPPYATFQSIVMNDSPEITKILFVSAGPLKEYKMPKDICDIIAPDSKFPDHYFERFNLLFKSNGKNYNFDKIFKRSAS